MKTGIRELKGRIGIVNFIPLPGACKMCEVDFLLSLGIDHTTLHRQTATGICLLLYSKRRRRSVTGFRVRVKRKEHHRVCTVEEGRKEWLMTWCRTAHGSSRWILNTKLYLVFIIKKREELRHEFYLCVFIFEDSFLFTVTADTSPWG